MREIKQSVADTRGIRELAALEAERIVSNAECATQFEFREEDDYRGTIVLNVEAGLVAFAESIVEQCAQVAEAHKKTIGENCWNHENSSEAETTCSDEIALAIRSRWQRGEGK